MKTPPWIPVASVAGVVYPAIGVTFATQPGLGWRWAAWAVSGAVFAAHICYEHLRLRSAPTRAALHVAAGAAAGAFGLAVAAIAHNLNLGTGDFRLLAIAVVAWPAITFVPAFLVALVAGALLGLRAKAGQF